MREKGYILPKSYRKLGVGFFVLSILTTTFIFYLIWAKVVVLIIPNTQTINSEFLFGISQEGNVEGGIVSGLVQTAEVEGSKTSKSTGSKTLDTNLVGEVTIVNNYSKDQALIETTRLAYADDPDKVIVRLNKNITVPAGGSVKVQVYPDNEENFEKVDPGKLIIPGLWGPLQDRIFAQVDAPLSKGAHQVAVVTQEDLDEASSGLRDELYQQALSNLDGELGANQKLWPKLVTPNSSEIEHSASVGEEISEFSTTLKLKVVMVVFDEDEVIALVKNKLEDTLADGKELIGLDPESFSYDVGDYNVESGNANVNVQVAVESALTSNAALFDKTKITGLTEEEAKSYFSQFSEVKDVSVEFHPSWLKKIPRFKDKIEIKIAK